MVTANEVSEHIGDNVAASFEVARGTDTETLQADPKSVMFGQSRRGPIVKLNYNKYNAFLPPWDLLVSFTLDGNGTATFAMPEYVGEKITGKLKTVEVRTPAVSLS